MSSEEIDLNESATGGVLNEALKDCYNDRSRFQTMFWILNAIKYMDAPSSSGWKRTAERLRKMGNVGIETEAARMFTPSFNKSGLRGWQDLVVAAVAVCACIDYASANPKIVERLLDNASADKNKAAIDKWTYTRDTLLEQSNTAALSAIEKFLRKLSDAIVKGTSPTMALRLIDAFPYGPGAETKEEKKAKEAKIAMLAEDENDDDF